jgi:repressor of nif and glnA expression
MNIKIDPKQKVAILRVLRDSGTAVSSSDVAKAIQAYGLDLSPRTVRLYLKQMEQGGLVEAATRGRAGGRRITARGAAEIEDAVALDRIGFTAAKVDRLAWEMDFDAESLAGRIVLNVTLIDSAYLPHACREMAAVFRAGLGMGNHLALIPEETRLGTVQIPRNKVGIGTVCSVTVNGILLNHRVYAVSRFGGVLEMRKGVPVRFTDLIAYEGTTLDPLEVFIKARLTDVHGAAITGNGRVGASFREIPTPAVPVVEKVKERLEQIGLGSIMMIGKPNQPLLDFPVQEGRTGIVVIGGLNPAAALEEAGIATSNVALCTLYEYNRLIHYRNMQRQAMELLQHS